ncbi:MAG: serine/threonine protein kinase [Lentisphaerae bacterium]|jgi:serine/threonine protein kinase|nr:serine/threonine protein kinase [Lentisphaerota bacterium]
MSGERLTYNKLGRFAEGGMASLSLIVLGDGRRALLRQLHASKVLNFARHRGFRFGLRVREALSPHPNIVNSLEWGYYGLRPYEIIELVEGQNLKALMNSRADILQRECVFIIVEAAEALAWIHRNGFMHLDVKPENFLLRETSSKPVVKLTDFDLAKRSTDNSPHPQPGTPGYMAPEQFNDKTAFPASDVFAFCLMAYQLCTGKSPFVGSTVRELRRHQSDMKTVPRAPLELNPNMPSRLSAIIMRGLEKRRENRYADMCELVADLKKK